MVCRSDNDTLHATSSNFRPEASRAGDTLLWAKNEVLLLIDSLVNATDEGDFASVQAHLAALNNRTADPAHRLALLLQLSVACAGVVDIAEVRAGVDRATLALDLAPALRSCLHQAPATASARCR